MNKHQKKYFFTGLLIIALIINLFIITNIVSAEDNKNFRDPEILDKIEGSEQGTEEEVTYFIGAIIDYTIPIVGGIFLLAIIYGGVLWMTAGGNEDKVKKGQKYIINSTIGLIIVLLANLLVAFVLNIFTVDEPGQEGQEQQSSIARINYV